MSSGLPRARADLLPLGVAWVAVVLLGALPPFWREAIPDVSWPLYLAERMLEGAQQGRDFFEVNPPLFLWLSIPPVLLQRLLGLPAWHGTLVLVLLSTALSLAIARTLLKVIEPDPARRQWLLVGAAFALLVLPGLNFTQREHLALVFTLPYVVLVAVRAAGKPVPLGLALLVGGMGGVGFSLKPHFVIPWVLLEAYLLSRLKWASLRRPEGVVVVGYGITYLVAVLILVPAYLPMALRFAPYYTRYLDNGILGALVLTSPWLLAAITVWVAHRALAGNHDPLRDGLGLAVAGFLAAALVQAKGFGYHYLGAQGFALILLIRVALSVVRGKGWYPSVLLVRFSPILALGVILSYGTGVVRDVGASGSPDQRRFAGLDPNYARLVSRVRVQAQGGTIFVFSTNPAVGWPLTSAAGARWGSRYMSLWPLAALYDRELWSAPNRIVDPRPLKARTGFEREFLEETLADLEHTPPRLLVVLEPDSTISGWGGAWRFDYLAYFSADPRFARILDNYREVEVVAGYHLLLRSAPAGTPVPAHADP